MEFEEPCIYRMRKILSDLSLKIEKALRNPSAATTSSGELSAAAKGFLEHLHMFNEIVDARMKMNPTEKLKRDNYLRDSVINLKSALEEVEALKSELEEERSRHKHIVQVISNEIFEENSLIEKIKMRHAAEIAKIRQESEAATARIKEESSVKSKRLEESEAEIARIKEESSLKTKRLEAEIEAGKSRLVDTLRENLSHERELLAKRSKVERRYLAVLAKYDTEVGELHRTMESLTEELSCLNERLKDLRDQLAVQDVQYVELKNEREKAILKAFTEDLENFEKNRAAKIIQRAWRCFYERSCMRKKKKSKKKK